MSVFEAIKGTLWNVPKDITTGILSFTTRESVSEVSTDSEADGEIHNHEVNMDAGAELLSKFQTNWSEMHQKSEENAKHAKAVDGQISELFMYLERQNDAINQFLMEISTLPQLLVDLKAATNRLESLEGQFEVVESELLKLEDACETQELHRNQRHHEYQLQMYQQKSSTELEQQKVKMARDHATRVQRYEHHLQKTLREKQQAFEATFKEEMQHYKKFGKTSPLFTKPSADRRSADLANFCPEADDSALNDFLQIDGADEATDETIADEDAVSDQVSVVSTGDPVTSAGDPVTSTGVPVTSTGDPVTSTGDPVTSTGDPVTSTGDPVTSEGDLSPFTGDSISFAQPTTQEPETESKPLELPTDTLETQTNNPDPTTDNNMSETPAKNADFINSNATAMQASKPDSEDTCK